MKAPKVKIKFDLKKIQDWLIRNVEKLAFGALALVALYYVYGAVMQDTFKKTADELQQHVTKAQSNRSSSTPTAPEDAPVAPKYDVAAHVILKEVSSEGKLTARPWAPPVVPIDTRRGQPTLLPVQDLQVAGDYGAFRCKGRDGVPSTRGFSWIVVTGLIPYEDQLDEYAKAFGLSEHRGDYDTPAYDRYEIQRAEVVGDGENEQPSWESIATWPQPFDPKRAPLLAPVFRDRLWEAGGEEVVPADYILEVGIVDPLGPLAFEKTWGRNVGHEKLPMPKFDAVAAPPAATPDAGEFEEEGDGGSEPSDESPPAGDDEAMDLTDAAPAGAAAPSKPAAAAPAAAARPSGSGFGGISFGGGAAAPRQPAAAAPSPARKSGEPAPAVEAPVEDPKLVEARNYKFFRFFDFKAKAGVRYKYRVRLRVYNPNYGIAEQHVKSDANLQDEHAWTPYSEASPMATGPRLNNVLVGSIATADGRNAEAVLNLLVRQFDTKTGADLATAQKVSRGQVANYREMHDGKTIDYKTNMLVVDVLGGERLTVAGDSKQSIPGIAALLDPSGNLVVQTELGDDRDYKEKLAGVAPPDDSKRTPRQTSPGTTSPRGGLNGPSMSPQLGGPRGLIEAARERIQ